MSITKKLLSQYQLWHYYKTSDLPFLSWHLERPKLEFFFSSFKFRHTRTNEMQHKTWTGNSCCPMKIASCCQATFHAHRLLSMLFEPCPFKPFYTAVVNKGGAHSCLKHFWWTETSSPNFSPFIFIVKMIIS